MVRISALAAAVALLVAGAITVFASHDAAARSSSGSISLVAYSTPRDAYSQVGGPGKPQRSTAVVVAISLLAVAIFAAIVWFVGYGG